MVTVKTRLGLRRRKNVMRTESLNVCSLVDEDQRAAGEVHVNVDGGGEK